MGGGWFKEPLGLAPSKEGFLGGEIPCEGTVVTFPGRCVLAVAVLLVIEPFGFHGLFVSVVDPAEEGISLPWLSLP